MIQRRTCSLQKTLWYTQAKLSRNTNGYRWYWQVLSLLVSALQKSSAPLWNETATTLWIDHEIHSGQSGCRLYSRRLAKWLHPLPQGVIWRFLKRKGKSRSKTWSFVALLRFLEKEAIGTRKQTNRRRIFPHIAYKSRVFLLVCSNFVHFFFGRLSLKLCCCEWLPSTVTVLQISEVLSALQPITHLLAYGHVSTYCKHFILLKITSSLQKCFIADNWQYASQFDIVSWD